MYNLFFQAGANAGHKVIFLGEHLPVIRQKPSFSKASENIVGDIDLIFVSPEPAEVGAPVGIIPNRTTERLEW